MISIFTLKGCPFCKKAMETLDTYNIPYKEKIIDSEEKKEMCKKQSGMRTFPQIYVTINSRNILLGGCDNLLELIKYVNTIKNNNISIDALTYFYKKIHSK
jgi:glutaredoxin 3